MLIQPTATVGERFTDNVFYTSSNADRGRRNPADPRGQRIGRYAALEGGVQRFGRGRRLYPDEQLDQIFANLYASGTGTIVPDRLFVDVNSVITQSSPLAGLGFVNPSLLPRTQQTQIYANTMSPYLRQSFDGLVDTELRYRFGATNFGGNTLAASPSLSPASTTLANSVLNEGTLTVASGQNFERALSRMTIDALNFNSSATDRNSQFNAFNDLEYRITPNFAALGRVGYQNIQYPFAPEATFAGATWLAGGRVAIGPNYGYVSLEYGRQQGVYGFTGSAQFQATPTISVSANLVQGISSPSQYLQTSLASSTLGPNGAIVDPYSGLPTAFYNPGLGLTNSVYRQHLFNAQISDVVRMNTYSLYGYYSDQQSLTPPITAPTKSVGAYLTWARDIRPDLNGSASLGYSNTTNIVTLSSVAPLSNISTWTANIGVNYLLSRALTGSVLYTFSYQPNGGAVCQRSQRRYSGQFVAVSADQGVLRRCTPIFTGSPRGRFS